ncbi:Protein LATERAL ROOT PRIMORDIUM 1 [Abeliophyllum distichum]|uniref:Protein LATERAL ROOT PRIMORDIUM 1 n=1 Tax=Abeliophyllum distichum TaxID=126358 RepID=A0ABD1TDV0_9LAMI
MIDPFSMEFCTISRLEEFAVVATTRRLQSDSGAFADWVASSSSSAGDLSLGFNAGPTAGDNSSNTGAGAGGGMWPSAAATRHVNYGVPPEFFVVAPASSFHHNTQHHHPEATTINFDPHGLNASNAAAAIGVGVIPLLTATPCLAAANMGSADEDLLNNTRNRSGSGMQLWQNQQLQNTCAYSKKPMIQDHNILLQSGSGGSSSGGIGGSSSGATTCQDCGNQAKKDCSRRRCRTCCRSRGYDCATHLKSTWVPAARRRERLAMTATAATAGSSQSTSGAKKPRLGTSLTTTASHTSTSNNTPPRSFDTSSSHQGASFKEPFPGQVRAPAVFKCVKVTAVDDGDDEYAYQAVVRIGGHVFKGFLYDQGVESREGFPNISDLHLGGSSGGGGGGGGEGRNGASSSSPVLDSSDVYASGGGGLLGGSNYGIPIN